MDTLTFIEKIVSSLAWPSVVLAIAIIFRDSLRDLLERITRFQAKGIDVTLAQAEEKILDAGQNLPQPKRVVLLPASKHVEEAKLKPPSQKIERVVPSPVDIAVRPVNVSNKTPRQTIENAWRRLERAVRELAGKKLIPSARSLGSMLANLEKLELFPVEIFYSIRGLEAARKDLKKTTKPIERRIAHSFADTADRIIALLQEEEFKE